MTYTEFLSSNNKKNIVLFELDLGVELNDNFWIKEEHTTWKITYYWDEETIDFSYGLGAWGYGAYGSSGTTTLLKSPRLSAIKIPSILTDGTPLVSTNSLEVCRDTAESFYFDDLNQILYINNNNSAYSPSYTYDTITLGITKGFSDISSYYNNIYYDGRLNNISNITESVDDLFYGKISFESGSVDLNNTDGFFDNFGQQDIYGAEIRIYYGSDEIDDGDKFDIKYTATLEDYSIDADTLTINFIDSRKFLSTKIPNNTYNKTDYPNMKDGNSGKIIPIGFGKIRGAEAVCTNEEATTSTYNFKFVDTTYHNIESIDAVYVENKVVTPSSTSTTDGTFSLSDTNYEPGDKVTIDFHGFTGLDNPLDVIKDVLTTYTQIQYNSAYFNITNWDALTSSITQKIGILIKDKKELVEIIEDISKSILGLLIIQEDGLFNFSFRDIEASISNTIYIDNFISPVSVDFAGDEYINSARVKFDKDWSEDFGRFVVDDSKKEKLFGKYRKNSERQFDTLLTEDSDASSLASEAIDAFGGVFPTYTIETKTNFIGLNLFDVIYIENKRYDDGTSALLKGEIISKDLNLNNFTITFKVRFLENLTNENITNLIRYRR